MYIEIASTIAILWIIQTSATAIARLTPTKKDDSWVQTSRQILESIGKIISTLGIPDRIELKKKK